MRLEGGLVLVRLLSVVDVHLCRAEVVVGEDVGLTLLRIAIVLALDAQQVIEIDMTIAEETGVIHVRTVVMHHNACQTGFLGEAVGLVALGRDEDRAVAVVVIIRGAAQLHITTLRSDGYVAHLLIGVAK